MANFAQGSLSTVALIPEVTYGVTPASAALVGIPFTDFNLNVTRSDFDDATIRADRMKASSINGTRATAGDIGVNLAHTAFDPMIAAALNSTWVTNAVSTGTTKTSFTIEQAQSDNATFASYTGCVVDKFSLSVPVNGPVTAKFSLIGKDGNFTTTSVGTSTTPAVQLEPYSHITGSVTVDGVAATTFSQLQIDVQNSFSANMVLGSPVAASMSYGMSAITGTITAYFDSNTTLLKFLNGTHAALVCTVADAAGTPNSHTFTLPNIKFTGASRDIKGQGSVTVQLTFIALRDTTTGKDILITRSS